jgi:hypothetical protein
MVSKGMLRPPVTESDKADACNSFGNPVLVSKSTCFLCNCLAKSIIKLVCLIHQQQEELAEIKV